MKRLLLIEDEDVIRRALTRFLERRGFAVTGTATVELAARESPAAFDVVLADLRLPGADGTAVIPLADPAPVVVMTSHASVRSAVEAMRAGATDYIAKPFDHDELLIVLERAMQHQRLSAENRALRDALARERPLHRLLEGTSLAALADAVAAAMAASAAARLPTRNARAYLYGEPGSAREALARGLHERLRGTDAPFVVFDPPALPDGSGAGAPAAPGMPLPRDALHGTFVLRHPELLDVRERRRIVEAADDADVMVVAIGGRAPDALVSAGTLDAAFVAAFDPLVEVPPLRRRADDAVLLARRAAAQVATRIARPGLALDAAAETWIRARDWPGNVTELDQVVQRAAALARGDAVGVRELADAAACASVGGSLSLDEYFRWFVLQHQGASSETELAARLGISRKALWERRQRAGLVRGGAPAGRRSGLASGPGRADPDDG